jgi:hypothetical protein
LFFLSFLILSFCIHTFGIKSIDRLSLFVYCVFVEIDVADGSAALDDGDRRWSTCTRCPHPLRRVGGRRFAGGSVKAGIAERFLLCRR